MTSAEGLDYHNAMEPLHHRGIAANYLPSRYHYWYARSKLATDPLYAAVRTVFTQTQAPLLDMGCGIGLLPQCLHASGFALAYRGVDVDARKIDVARSAAAAGKLHQASFDVCDLARAFPEHRGSVALLDVLQYFEPDARDDLLGRVAQCITPAGRLIIRTGLDDHSWRATITRAADRLGYLTRWVRTPPRAQPTGAHLIALLARHGLKCELQPLAGKMPFNNWLLIGRLQAGERN